MMRVYTTPMGRQRLLSNLVVRNTMYGKVLTIIVEGEDVYVKDKLVSPQMRIYVPNAEEPTYFPARAEDAHEEFERLLK